MLYKGELKVIKKLSLVLILVSLPVLVWSFAKPVRLLLPHLNDMKCHNSVCVEHTKEMAKAEELYGSAFDAVSSAGIPLRSKPMFVYCSTLECYQSFGGGNERAISYPFLGTVIAPASWQSYITQHELIHWFQFSEIGAVATMMKPEWFREGMAYVYSNAPESDIPEHYLPLMERYKDWHSKKSWTEVIEQAGEL
ncbi:hypothetical protein CWC33_06265 [Idiomarina sp. X4]|nr:hypothetical protein CWC33_06265 [Idiomarina sp. X4]